MLIWLENGSNDEYTPQYSYSLLALKRLKKSADLKMN